MARTSAVVFRLRRISRMPPPVSSGGFAPYLKNLAASKSSRTSPECYLVGPVWFAQNQRFFTIGPAALRLWGKNRQILGPSRRHSPGLQPPPSPARQPPLDPDPRPTSSRWPLAAGAPAAPNRRRNSSGLDFNRWLRRYPPTLQSATRMVVNRGPASPGRSRATPDLSAGTPPDNSLGRCSASLV